MRSSIPYKNCLVSGESFQRESNGKWTAQYLVTRLNTGSERTGFPSQQYQLNEVFPTEKEADDFAVRRAQEWIDETNYSHDDDQTFK
ncbi:MAG TPA: hypothetical protein VHM64_24655 [Candidatus Binatia bacterium]|nr:hypothetical protein [Candidatus Binatia bacterium]